MAKRKNHTNHNQNRKAHRNGIRKPKMPELWNMPGIHPRRNQEIAELKAAHAKPQTK